jgi:glutamyl-tRNA synthetase
MNGAYIRSLSLDDFTQRTLPFLENGLPAGVRQPLSIDYVRQVMPLIQERARTLAEIPELTAFFFTDELDYEPSLLIVKKMDRESSTQALETVRQRLAPLQAFDTMSLETVVRPLAAEMGLKTGQLFGTLRVAITGRTVAPPLFETMSILGKERSLERVRAALDKLGSL